MVHQLLLLLNHHNLLLLAGHDGCRVLMVVVLLLLLLLLLLLTARDHTIVRVASYLSRRTVGARLLAVVRRAAVHACRHLCQLRQSRNRTRSRDVGVRVRVDSWIAGASHGMVLRHVGVSVGVRVVRMMRRVWVVVMVVVWLVVIQVATVLVVSATSSHCCGRGCGGGAVL